MAEHHKALLLWADAAVEDMRDIYRYIARDNVDAAERTLSALSTRAELLLAYPRVGMRMATLDPSARMLLEGKYKILYRTHPNTDSGPVDVVEIERVIHGRRDLRRVF